MFQDSNYHERLSNAYRAILPVILFFGLTPLWVASQQTVFTKPDHSEPNLISEIFVLKDSLGHLSITDVRNVQTEKYFKPFDAASFDQRSKSYWLKIKVQGRSKKQVLWMLKIPYIDTSELYLPNDTGYSNLITGTDIPFGKWAVKYAEFPYLPVPVTDSVKTYYLRLTSVTGFSFELRKLKVIKFIEPDSFTSASHTSRYFHGIFLGIMFAMIVLNIIIYLIYRERSYLVYALFMITHTLWHLSITGYLLEYVFYNHPRIGRHFPFEIAGISLISYIFFSQVYLESKKYTPKLNKYYNWLYVLIGGDVCLGYIININITNSVLLLLGVIVIVFPFFMAIINYRKKYRPAIFFLIASVLSYIAYVVFVLMGLKLIPEIFITRYSLQCSIALQSLLFGMGLADRMNLIRRELEVKKLEKIQLEKDNAIAIQTILEKQNEELEIKVHERTIELEDKNREVENASRIIQKERERSDQLLLNILPEKIAERLKSGEEMIAEKFDNVTVFFSDIVDFTKLSKGISPRDLVTNLNAIFSEFDELTMEYGLEKIKTIGDGYMCVCGLPEPQPDHAKRVALFALRVQHAIEKYKHLVSDEIISVRMGIHSGTVIAGVIGNRKFAYDLWGETVNTASRMESHGLASHIQCSQATYELLKKDFDLQERGDIIVKGIGEMKTYFLLSQKYPQVSKD